ncbi:MAG: caiA, partial [Methylobacterium sp.]|nr:caiA [Methylobacterium sp.]
MNIAVSAQVLESHRLPEGAPGPVRSSEPAHIIRDDAEALRIATRLAAEFRVGASERDRTGRRPLPELDAFSQSGLWSINVPRAHG